MMRIFIGFDPRQPVAYQVLAFSIARRASRPVSIAPLILSQLPIERRGLTEFTYSRYLVPHLCDYDGEALFLDADMLCLTDIHEIVDELPKGRPAPAVSVVKNARRFEWPSLMYFNCGKCNELTPEYIETAEPQSFDWAGGAKIGTIDPAWNHIVGYDAPRDDALIVHFTAGIPCFPETENCEYGEAWRNESMHAMSTCTWQEIMGTSVHAPMVAAGGLAP